MKESRILVKISYASMMLPFQGCSPDYIKSTCHGACCHLKSKPHGPIVLVEKDQQKALRQRGAKFKLNVIQTVNSKCTFQSTEGFCNLHGTDDKPRSCIQSPFFLTSRDTLIVRNRYRLLCCFKAEPKLPAYKAFASSLLLLFGEEEANRIHHTLSTVKGNFHAWMLSSRYKFLRSVAHTWGLSNATEGAKVKWAK